MPRPKSTIAAMVLGLAALPALAEDLPGFTYAEACRIDDTSAVIRMVYQGGNCETTAKLDPVVTLDRSIAAITIPSASTSEICTLQIVPNNVQKTVAIAADTVALDITLLLPDGSPQGRQTVALQPNGPDCPL